MMGWTPRPTASMCQSGGVEHHLREASVSEVSIIGLDIAKHVFQAHGVDALGRAVLRKKISRAKLLPFFASQPRCRVVLEACGGARRGGALGRRPLRATLMGWTPPDGILVPRWRC